MPLKVNVGLSRKIGEANYGSRGASVNVELELDSSLIGDSAKFQERIRQVYGLARTSLNEELNGGANDQTGNGHANGNGAQQTNGNSAQPTNGNGQAGNGAPPANGQRPRQATQSQVKALHAFARNQRFDLARYLSEHYRVNRPEDLDLKTASSIIDALNAANQPGRPTAQPHQQQS